MPFWGPNITEALELYEKITGKYPGGWAPDYFHMEVDKLIDMQSDGSLYPEDWAARVLPKLRELKNATH